MATPTSNVWRMADTLAGGKLEKRITDLHSKGLKPEAIARQLYADCGIDVTRQTIYNWLSTLSAPDPSGEAA